MKIDWKSKLSSRKFWALIAGLVVSIMVLLGTPESVQLQVAGIIGSVGSVVAYIVGESIVDASKNKE